MEEKWKIIKSNPQYAISNKGRVKNIITNFILTPTVHGLNRGMAYPYLRIELKRPRKKYLVHRLVAEAFISNPLNYDQINHKDNNGFNNSVGNLEWCNLAYNVRYSQLKPVLQFDKGNNLLNEFNSLTDAGILTNSDYRLISAVCLGKRRAHNGFIWAYKNKEDLLSKRRGNGRFVA